MKCNRQNFLSVWAKFCLFTLLTTQKIKNSEKMRKHLKISFYTSVPKIMIICYTVPETWYVTDVNCYLLFWAIFCPFTP